LKFNHFVFKLKLMDSSPIHIKKASQYNGKAFYY
jgi:hypothetical protein